MAIVNCPECSKKLKVADTSVGKKVKCSCGQVFVAEVEDAAPPRRPAAMVAAVPEKVLVACSECSAKLKVATTSLGKKMKCPKCASVFTAEIEEEAPSPSPVKKGKAPPPRPVEIDDDEPVSRSKAKGKPAKDDEEDLFTFAQGDADADENAFADEDDMPKAKAKFGKQSAPAEDDDDDDRPKSKFGAKKGTKPSRSDDDDDDNDADKKPVYPRRTVLNLFVFLLLIGFIAFFAVVFLDVIKLDFLPKADLKGLKIEVGDKGIKKGKDGAIDNKAEAAKLDGTWIVESAEAPGFVLDALKGKKFIFADGMVTTPDPVEAPFTVDASKEPKWIEFPTSAKINVPGIYKLDGDTLQLCTSIPIEEVKDGKKVMEPGDRPTQFDAKQGMLIILKRDKQKDDGKDESEKKDKDKITDKGKSKDKDNVSDKDKGKDKEKDKEVGKDKDKDSPVIFFDAAGDGVPAWKVPEGWKEGKGNQFTVAAFAVKDKEKSAAITVSLLSGKAGGVLANVNRWRAQIKLEAWSEAELVKQSKKIVVSNTEAVFVELVGVSTTTLGVIVYHENQAWFFKLTGDVDLAQREKENFTKFVKSVKFR